MIPLGLQVKDLITGMKGVAVARTEWLYGCARIGVEHEVIPKNGKPREMEWFDEQRVTALRKVGLEAAKPREPKPLPLGSKAKDTVTGFKGLLIGRTVWVSGDVNYTIEPTELHQGQPIKAHSFDANRIEIIERKAPPVSPQHSATSGGPQRDLSPRRQGEGA